MKIKVHVPRYATDSPDNLFIGPCSQPLTPEHEAELAGFPESGALDSEDRGVYVRCRLKGYTPPAAFCAARNAWSPVLSALYRKSAAEREALASEMGWTLRDFQLLEARKGLR